MTTETKDTGTTRHWYAAQSPRGFANEIRVHRFSDRQERDKWVDAHADDGDCSSAARGAYATTAREAQAILRRKDDAVTEQCNVLIEHD